MESLFMLRYHLDMLMKYWANGIKILPIGKVSAQSLAAYSLLWKGSRQIRSRRGQKRQVDSGTKPRLGWAGRRSSYSRWMLSIVPPDATGDPNRNEVNEPNGNCEDV